MRFWGSLPPKGIPPDEEEEVLRPEKKHRSSEEADNGIWDSETSEKTEKQKPSLIDEEQAWYDDPMDPTNDLWDWD